MQGQSPSVGVQTVACSMSGIGTHFTKPLGAHSWNLVKIPFCTHSYSNNSIRSQFCTCHDSWAVVACANLCHDLIIIFHVRTTNIFLQNLHYHFINPLWDGSRPCGHGNPDTFACRWIWKFWHLLGTGLTKSVYSWELWQEFLWEGYTWLVYHLTLTQPGIFF